MVRIACLGLVVSVILHAAAMSARGAAAIDAPRRPNVVILLADQWRWAETGCYGHPVIRTPNVDRLAAAAGRFTHAFSNFPLCSPARSVLLSGRYARSNGVRGNQDQEAQPGRPTNQETTIAEALGRADYLTALVGKWHLRPTPAALGFAESLRCRMRHRYYRQVYYRNEGEPYVCEEYSPHHETEAAVQFIRDHADRPFFLFVSYGPPHMPLAELPDRYRTMYDPARVLLRENVYKDGRMAFNEHWFKIYMWDFQYYENTDTFPHGLPKDMDLRDLIALYYGQITAVDDCIGRVLDAIRETGLEEDTIVLFTSDHGDLLGSHQLFNKNAHYDEAVRVPMAIRYPRRIKPAVISEQIASLVDVMPTLLELCGVPVPDSVQGTSLTPVLEGREETVGENAAFIETSTADGIRTHRFMYSVNRKKPRQEQLFDCEADPFQMNDLSAEPAHAQTLASLRERLAAWRDRMPAQAPASEPAR